MSQVQPALPASRGGETRRSRTVGFHNGRAAKLPRTDVALGLHEIQRVAQALRKRQRQAARERRHAIHEELRAPRLLPDQEELALKRELAALKLRGMTRPMLLLE